MRSEGSKIEFKMKARVIVSGILFILFIFLAFFFCHYTHCRPHATKASSANLSTTARLSCGPAALMAVAQAHSDKTATKLHFLLTENQSAKNRVASLYDLTNFARDVGLNPIGLKVNPTDLTELPLPAIVHIRPNHFLALMTLNDERAVVIDQGRVRQNIPRLDFNQLFSGYVLCFQ